MKQVKIFLLFYALAVGVFGGINQDLAALRQGIIYVETDLTKEWLTTGRSLFDEL